MQIEPDFYPWLSVAALAWGALDCFFGYRVFKVTLALVGGLLGAALARVLADRLGASHGVMVGAMIGSALLGALLSFLLYIAAVFVAGFGFAATLGMLLLAHYHQMVALLSGLVLGVIGGFLAIKLQRILIILSTALLGSFRAILALAYFTSRLDWMFYFRQPDQLPAVIESNAWMLPAILALATVGVIAQLEIGGGSKPAAKKKPAKDN